MVLAYPPQRMKRSLTVNSNYPPQGLVSNGAVGLLDMEFESNWFDLDFKQRIPLTINPGQVPSTQTDFPLLINAKYLDLIGEVEAEIRFAGIDKVQLEYEIQDFTDFSGELIAWVKKPTVSDDDFIGIYFDNPGATDEQNSAAVWDSNYKYVGHLQNNANDSTGNAQNMTNFGTALSPVPAKIGDGQLYGGTVNDYSIRNPFTGFPTTEITAECWIKTPGTSDGMISYAIGSAALANNFLLDIQQQLRTVIVNLGAFSTTSVNDNTFHHLVSTWRSFDGQLVMYLDGIVILSTTLRQGASMTDNGSLVLAQDQDSLGGGFDPLMSYDGILDEVRISDTFRSADYVTTSFNNQNINNIFYTTGAVESAPPSLDLGVMEFETLGTMEFES